MAPPARGPEGWHRGDGQGHLQVIVFSPVAIGTGGGRFIRRPRPRAPLYREPYLREARENRKPSLIPRNHPSVVLPSARARSRTIRPELELEGAGITAGGMTCGCGRAGCGSVPAGGSAMLRSCAVTVGPTTLESATRGRLLTTPLPPTVSVSITRAASSWPLPLSLSCAAGA